LFLFVPWLCTLWGIALIALSLLEYSGHAQQQPGLTVSGFESSLNAVPLHQLQFKGTLGLVSLGLGGALFYLRRRYLSRQQ
jgi:hypothetical protein